MQMVWCFTLLHRMVPLAAFSFSHHLDREVASVMGYAESQRLLLRFRIGICMEHILPNSIQNIFFRKELRIAPATHQILQTDNASTIICRSSVETIWPFVWITPKLGDCT